MTGSTTAFVGREQQLERLQACVFEVRTGVPWIVAVTGEAGIGKTALVHRLVDGLTDMDVFWASCDASEQDYAYGVIDQLIRKLSPASAVGTAALRKGTFTEAQLGEAGAELLQALTTAQRARPVALVVDDVQWADPASVACLGFLTRRMWHERVLMALTARTDTDDLHDPAAAQSEPRWLRMTVSAEHGLLLRMTGMEEHEIPQLAQTLGAGPLSPAAVGRLHAHTNGNPLYLHSLLTEASTGDLADPSLALPAPQALAAAVQQGLNRLGAESRRLVEALSVLGGTVPLARAAQTAGVTDPAEALSQALDSGLVRWWPSEPSTPVQIKHMMQQEVIAQSIPPTRRAALHAAAASVVDASAAWPHRVAAAAGQLDPTLAAELEAESDRLAACGQLSRAATFNLWAADLSVRPEEHDHRALTGVFRILLARDYPRCLTLRETVEPCAESAARTCALGGIAYAQGDLREAESHLTKAIKDAEAEEVSPVAALASVLLGATYSRQHRLDKALPLLLQAMGLNLPEPRAVNYARHLLTLASASIAQASVRSPEAGPDKADAESVARTELASSLLLNPRGILREMANELHAGTGALKTLVRRQRVGEAIDVQVREYFMLAAFQYLAGVWDDATVTANKSLTVAASTGQLFNFATGHAIASMAAATEGRLAVAEDQLQSSEQAARCTQLPLDMVYPVMAQVILAQARGDATAMSQALTRLPQPGSSGWQSWWLPLQVEACAGAGRLDEAADALARLEALAEDVPSLKLTARWLVGELAEAHGEPDSARDTYETALRLPGEPDEIPLHRARLEHAYGRVLRSYDRAAALEYLDKARRRYLAVGAPSLASRAGNDAVEFSGLSEPSHAPALAPARNGILTELTERERAVALLVAEGMTNKEVAKRLYVSVKTVEYHLGNIFTKLDLASRHDLRTALAPEQTDGRHTDDLES